MTLQVSWVSMTFALAQTAALTITGGLATRPVIAFLAGTRITEKVIFFARDLFLNKIFESSTSLQSVEFFAIRSVSVLAGMAVAAKVAGVAVGFSQGFLLFAAYSAVGACINGYIITAFARNETFRNYRKLFTF